VCGPARARRRRRTERRAGVGSIAHKLPSQTFLTMLELSKKSPSTAAAEIRQGSSAYGR
jgi:hypothetical protein